MIYISIDVGIKNLAYIIYNSDTNIILEWNVLELCEKGQKANCINLIDIGKQLCNQFHECFSDYLFDIIIIENQIGQNAIRMKTLQGMITMYFIHEGNNNIYHWNACNKLKHYDVPKKTTYNERKKLSIQITKDIIELEYNDWYNFYLSHKKKDDLADCFLQLKDAIKKV